MFAVLCRILRKSSNKVAAFDQFRCDNSSCGAYWTSEEDFELSLLRHSESGGWISAQ